MNDRFTTTNGEGSWIDARSSCRERDGEGWPVSESENKGLRAIIDNAIVMIAPSPWVAHAGGDSLRDPHKHALYSADERLRRDASPWTLVQGILAPLQFLIFAVSLGLVLRYLATGQGYHLATASILVKTVALYAIMITGSIWEKDVFGRWLFAPAFFWEDVFSMLVLGLQTTYVFALLAGWGTPREQMMIAVAAYATYVVNATQFLLKLRAARLEGALRPSVAPEGMGQPA